jgi:DNA polymerase-3 subunit delta
VKLADFRRILAELSLRPVLVVVGAEPYLKTLIVEALKKKGAEAHGDGFACQTFYAHSRTAREAIAECRAGEFFVTAKLVLLHEIDRYRKEDLGVLADYVKSPDPAVSLVMTAESVDGRTGFAKAIAKVPGGRADLKTMYDSEMPAWIDALAKRRGKRVGRAAREALAELCGTNLTALAAEIEKLELYVGEREQIEEADVAAVVGRGRTETYYRLRDAILEGRAGEALEIWGLLAAEGENVYALFGRLRSTLRELVNAKELAEAGADMQQVGRALGIPTWRQRDLCPVLAKTSLEKLRRNLVLVFEADVDLRQTRLSDRQIAERLFVLLCAA